MARSDERYMVYPAPRAVEIVGGRAPSLNQAIECWAAQLAWATADNARSFSQSYWHDLGDTCEVHELHDWAVLAHSIRDKPFDPQFSRPGELLAAAVEDAHRLESIGGEWFQSNADITWKEVDNAIAKLAKKLRDLDYAHAWAIIVAVQWFWDHQDGIKVDKDEWWTLSYRRQWNRDQPDKENSQEHALIRTQDSQQHALFGKRASKKKPGTEKGK
jgi:hypothetical protein